MLYILNLFFFFTIKKRVEEQKEIKIAVKFGEEIPKNQVWSLKEEEEEKKVENYIVIN